MIKWFVAGCLIGFAAGFYSVVCRVEAEKMKRAAVEKQLEIERAKRIDDAVEYEDDIEILRRDVEVYRADYRRRVQKELGIE